MLGGVWRVALLLPTSRHARNAAFIVIRRPCGRRFAWWWDILAHGWFCGTLSWPCCIC